MLLITAFLHNARLSGALLLSWPCKLMILGMQCLPSTVRIHLHQSALNAGWAAAPGGLY